MPRDINDDARKFLGLPPHNHPSNFVTNDAGYYRNCEQEHGPVQFAAACQRVREAEAKRTAFAVNAPLIIAELVLAAQSAKNYILDHGDSRTMAPVIESLERAIKGAAK